MEKNGSPQPSSQSKPQVVHPFTVDEKVLIKVRLAYHVVFVTMYMSWVLFGFLLHSSWVKDFFAV